MEHITGWEGFVPGFIFGLISIMIFSWLISFMHFFFRVRFYWKSTRLRRLDHGEENVPRLEPMVEYLKKKFIGFHEFAEFTAWDVGMAKSWLNSMVLANNEKNMLIPLNGPVFRAKRKSQNKTSSEHNEGPGIQHLALMSDDISYDTKRNEEEE
ncbi:hypothetical protein ACS0TY_013132 [Phlomoides rotata]